MNQSIKRKLFDYYSKNWDGFKEELKNHDVFAFGHHAHLLSTTKEFENQWNDADIRIMLFGISTNGWGKGNIYDLPSDVAINQLMSGYENFYFDGGNWRYGQVFWNYFFALHEILKFRLQANIEMIWNNVHKTHKQLRDVEARLFNPTFSEMEIFDPDYIILFGKEDEHILLSKLSGIGFNSPREVTYDDEEEKKLLFREYETINGSSGRLKKVFVTYHPNAHWNAGIKLKLLIDQIAESVNSASKKP